MPSIVIAQGGGPTAVINQTLCGAILAARKDDPSLRILGARYGVRGLTAGNVVDLTAVPEADLYRLGNTPNSALALQLPFLKISESMGNHDSKIVDADSVD
jgi:6-phosphofructokinase